MYLSTVTAWTPDWSVKILLTAPYQGHVDAGTEGDCGHRVQHVDIELGQEGGAGEPRPHRLHGGVGVDRYIGDDIPGSERVFSHFLSSKGGFIKLYSDQKEQEEVQINETRTEIRSESLNIKMERVEDIKVNY